MTISAKVIEHSVSREGIRLTTFQLRYPRFIHSEIMTHRMFSRNASSSRAIPVAKLIEDVERDPATPVYWGKNQPGMQAKEELTGQNFELAQSLWQRGRHRAIATAKAMADIGAHKQIVNRILEPFAHINVVVTATDYVNFYELRRHADAQPEIKALADAMYEAQQESTPHLLQPGEWHLPYITDEEWAWNRKQPDILRQLNLQVLRKCSVARCARVSYLTHEGKEPDVGRDLVLYTDLVGSRPLHASPAEHQATPDRCAFPGVAWEKPALHGNFRGWIQNRKMIELAA